MSAKKLENGFLEAPQNFGKTQMANDEFENEEAVDDLDEASEIIPYTYSITSYGADYPVDSLVKRIVAKDIVVPTFNWNPSEKTDLIGFQRQYIWPRPKADRFIESLLLGLPVPGIFLVKEPSGVLLVLDGHQRLFTLNSYYEGIISGEEYRLANVQDRFSGRRYKDLDVEDRRRLDNSIIHATVIRQDEPMEDQSSIYVIFERLNTGGINLQPQEIRVALYHGGLVRVLQDLNNNKSWRELYGRKSNRLKDMEMIVRFFALFFYSSKYESPMKDFLNKYMATNRNLQKQKESELRHIFTLTTEAILEMIGHQAFRPKRAINAAVIDSLMIGVARRLCKGEVNDKKRFNEAFAELMKNDYYIASVETGTSQETNVKNRINLAEQAFSQIP